MRKIIFLFLLIVFLWSNPVSALESRCFTDYAELSSVSVSPQIFSLERAYEDVFFTQDGHVVPSRPKNVIQRESYGYTLSSTIPISDTGALIDDLSSTAISLQPTDAPEGFSITLTFDTPIVRGTSVPVIDIVTPGTVSTSISRDGQTYTPVSIGQLAEYDFGFLRIDVRPRANSPVPSYSLRTIRFDKKQQAIYIVQGQKNIPMVVYRGWICDREKLSALIATRENISSVIDISIPVNSPIVLDFSPLPTTGKDTDGDTIIDMRDNCIRVANIDQPDRNYDGIGDACSDDDGDGVVGASDNCPTVANRDQRDLNNNKIGDACEFDSDNDSISDGVDNCIRISNGDQRDIDSDGIGDACDNCSLYNPDQLDLDKTGVGDTCEQVEKSKRDNDKDADGIVDNIDNCRDTSNSDQLDADADSIGDACDNCRSIQNRDQNDENKNSIGDMCEDVDSDGVDGWRDNCPTFANPDQLDADNDMVGDACTDTDRDTHYDGVDNCPLISNRDQKDIDADSVGDICDESDNRFIESNRTLFMILFGSISLIFIGGIVYFIRKIQL